MTERVIIRAIHGIHSPEGNNNMEAFAGSLQRAMPEASVRVFSYGFMGFWAARFNNAGVARQLAQVHQEARALTWLPEVWVTHSNGAAIAYMAIRDRGARPDMVININPALDRWRVARVMAVETIHSDSDRWVWLSQWLVGHIWGDQGREGIGEFMLRKPEHNRYINHRAEDFGDMAYSGHTGAFAPKVRDQWAHFISNRIRISLLGAPASLTNMPRNDRR